MPAKTDTHAGKHPPRTRKRSKTFVLDTNVLLHNAESIFSFSDNTVVLPMAVMEELDKFKTHNDELGRNSRQVIRTIDALRASGGNLRDGVKLKSGGCLKIFSGKCDVADSALEENIPDNKIIRVALHLAQTGHKVVFVTKDINARLKADTLGLQSVDFEKQKVNFDDLYPGYSEIIVPQKTIEDFFRNELYENNKLGTYPNEFLFMKAAGNERKTALARVIRPGLLKHLASKHDQVWNIQARNKEQRMSLEHLMDPDVQLVTLVGKAGTGKTLLALAAALHMTIRNHRYDGILVSRPIVPLGKDIGYLPGPKEEKLSHWMQPIFDNLAFLLRDARELDTLLGMYAGKKKKTKATTQDRVEKLLQDNLLTLEALTYIRGRSLPRQYVIIDEAQNLTPHEVKTIISRAGEGTKMVLTGDPYQIDNPYLDASSNGLTYASERMKQHPIHGHITLHTSVRSSLAAIAAEIL